jgi:ribosome-associated protein YbcJ (S4-like RNA binding protein)
MAKRPIKDKQFKRLRKAINRRPLPAYVDLVWWLRSRGHANTSGQAIRLMLDGKVKLESHVVGRERVSRIVAGQTVEQWEPVTRVQGHLRDIGPKLLVT